eukprot:TRINITY_DN2816_c0_g1_i5.p1 TRINITY_DN2816_c0_g1~~TRINITY_DN2816_c0_g1_i5.p1  ORF type:complete len:375 (-),score=69.65 TRINITY_DN2816_c0_g1_i5:548-1672(-)
MDSDYADEKDDWVFDSLSRYRVYEEYELPDLVQAHCYVGLECQSYPYIAIATHYPHGRYNDVQLLRLPMRQLTDHHKSLSDDHGLEIASGCPLESEATKLVHVPHSSLVLAYSASNSTLRLVDFLPPSDNQDHHVAVGSILHDWQIPENDWKGSMFVVDRQTFGQPMVLCSSHPQHGILIDIATFKTQSFGSKENTVAPSACIELEAMHNSSGFIATDRDGGLHILDPRDPAFLTATFPFPGPHHDKFCTSAILSEHGHSAVMMSESGMLSTHEVRMNAQISCTLQHESHHSGAQDQPKNYSIQKTGMQDRPFSVSGFGNDIAIYQISPSIAQVFSHCGPSPTTLKLSHSWHPTLNEICVSFGLDQLTQVGVHG